MYLENVMYTDYIHEWPPRLGHQELFLWFGFLQRYHTNRQNDMTVLVYKLQELRGVGARPKIAFFIYLCHMNILP